MYLVFLLEEILMGIGVVVGLISGGTTKYI